MNTEIDRKLVIKLVLDALDVGIYGKRTVTSDGKIIHDRTPYEEGWNDASIKICEQTCKKLEEFESKGISDDLALLLLANCIYYFDNKLHLNLNDTFWWATADSEIIEDKDIPELAKWYHSYGYIGLVYWTSEKRKIVPEIQTYKEDIVYLKNKFSEDKTQNININSEK